MKEYKFLSERKNTSIFGDKKETTQVVKNNSSKWQKGDYLRHKTYGVGQVIDVVGDVLVIDFKEHGIKKILSYYVGIEKIFLKEVEL